MEPQQKPKSKVETHLVRGSLTKTDCCDVLFLYQQPSFLNIITELTFAEEKCREKQAS